MKVKLIDKILGSDPSFCRGRVPKFFEYTSADTADKYLYSHGEMFNEFINTPKEQNFGIAIESRAIMPMIYNSLESAAMRSFLKSKFNCIFTCQQDIVDLDKELFKWCPASGVYIGTEYGGGEIKVYPKTKRISMVASGKSWVRGHKLRLAIARGLASTNKVDVFGDSVNKPIAHIVDGLSPYQYSVVIENDRSAGYFTEKLLNCFAVGTIPVYWGATDIMNDRVFDPSGILIVDPSESINALVDRIQTDDHSKRLAAIRSNLIYCQEFICPEDYIFEHYWNSPATKI